PVGDAMAEIGMNGDAWIWIGPGAPRHVFSDPTTRFIGGAFSPDGKHFVTYDSAQTFQVWDAANGESIRKFGGELPRPQRMAMSPDGRHLATIAQTAVTGAAMAGASMPEKLRIWDYVAGKLLREIEFGDNGGRVANWLSLYYTPDGRSIVVTNSFP